VFFITYKYNVIESGPLWNIESHEFFGLGIGEICECSLSVEGVVLGVSVEKCDLCLVFEVYGKAVVFQCLGLISLVELSSVCPELGVAL
jgi:hypothetical protein